MSSISQHGKPLLPAEGKPSREDIAHGLVVGIVGGIASGKSEISRILESMGASVFNADQIGHRLLNREDIREKIVKLFGNECLDARGAVDRKFLAKCFFSGPSDRLSQLEAILHPVIFQEAKQAIEAVRENGTQSLLVLDAPLLIEAGWQSLCDKIIFIDTPLKMRLANIQSRGWSEQELVVREKTQLALEVKKQFATDIIPNKGSLEDLQAELLGLPWLAKLIAPNS